MQPGNFMTSTTVKTGDVKTFKNYRAFDHLKDGRTVLVRAIRPEDRCLLKEGMHHLSKQSLYFRFFIYKDTLSAKELEYFSNVDFVKHVALLAGFYQDGKFSPAGTARYIVSSEAQPPSAEFAITVAEEYHSLGFGTILLKHLFDIARANGIKHCTAMILQENTKMLGLLMKCGYPVKRVLDHLGEWDVQLSLDDQEG